MRYVAGIDEVGRGPLAGPVFAAAVLLPVGFRLKEARGRPGVGSALPLRDSKKLSRRQRDEWFRIIKGEERVFWAVARVGPRVIDKINIRQAADLAATRALFRVARVFCAARARACPKTPYPASIPIFLAASRPSFLEISSDIPGVGRTSFARKSRHVARDVGFWTCFKARIREVILDGGLRVVLPEDLMKAGVRARAIIRGDEKFNAIKLASIMAKVSRDAFMKRQDGKYRGYGFALHKGYGTRAHIAALRRLGPCPAHRLTFIGGLT